LRRYTKGQLLAKGPTLSVKLALLTFRQSELVNKLPRTIVCPAVMAGPPRPSATRPPRPSGTRPPRPPRLSARPGTFLDFAENTSAGLIVCTGYI